MRKPFIICILIASVMLLPACMNSDKIDQKLQALNEQLQQQQSDSEMSPEEIQELIDKIELYTTPTPGMARDIVNENRYIDITAKDLNMSESTFEAFQKRLEELNVSLSTMEMKMDSIPFPQKELDRMLE